MKTLLKPILFLFIAVPLMTISSTTTKAWAAQETLQKSQSLSVPHTKAPEPSSLLLFGSGVFTMLLAFLKRAYHISKRIMDIVISSLSLVILSPLCLVTVILIKLTSRGPVFFLSRRCG